MAERRTSEIWKGARRGAGWAAGFSFVLGAASVVRNGPRPAAKGSMKQLLRLRESGAELAEQVQDLYAEARVEYDAERAGGQEAGPPAPG